MTEEEKKAIIESLENTLGCSLKVLGELIRECSIAEEFEHSSEIDNSLDERTKQLFDEVTALMNEIGVPAKVKGYNYLREAIVMVVKKPMRINNMVKHLYIVIAENFETTPSAVERAIRNAIKSTWTNGNKSALKNVFGETFYFSNVKEQNRSFIKMITQYLKSKNNY